MVQVWRIANPEQRERDQYLRFDGVLEYSQESGLLSQAKSSIFNAMESVDFEKVSMVGRRLPNNVCNQLIIIRNWQFSIDSCPHCCPQQFSVARIVANQISPCFGRLPKKSLRRFCISGRRRRNPRHESDSCQNSLRRAYGFQGCNPPARTDGARTRHWCSGQGVSGARNAFRWGCSGLWWLPAWLLTYRRGQFPGAVTVGQCAVG